MGRPHKERRVEQLPPVKHYKPASVPFRGLNETILTIEEMEAIRLADVEGLDQAEAAGRMEVSRPTFNRIVSMAHQKIATALWHGNAIRVDGGNFRISHPCQTGLRHCICQTCGHEWSLPHGLGQKYNDLVCPTCQATNILHE